jgi:hypothetical protein
MSDEIHNNFNLALVALKHSKSPLDDVVPYLSKRLKNSEKFMLEAISLCPSIIFKLSKHLGNETLLLKALNFEPHYVKFYYVTFRTNIEFIKKAIETNHKVFLYIDEHIKTNIEVKKIYDENNTSVPFDWCFVMKFISC